MFLENLIENNRFDEIIHHVRHVDPGCASDTDIFMQTPLHLVCGKSYDNIASNVNEEELSLLLEKVVKTLLAAYPMALTDVDEDGRTPLHCACMAFPLQPQIISVLISEIAASSSKKSNVDDCNQYIKLPTQTRTRNSPLHLLCQNTAWSQASLSKKYETALFQVLHLLLLKSPMSALSRNYTGVTPLYLVFAWKYNSYRRKDYNIVYESNKDEWKRRWKAVLSIIRYVATANCRSILFDEKTLSILQEDDKPFLYLHATLHIDRTELIWDTMMHFYGHQVSIPGTCYGAISTFPPLNLQTNQSTDKHITDQNNVIVGNYPLAIAASQCTFNDSKIADRVIAQLCNAFPEAAKHPVSFCSCGGTVLEHAIRSHLHFDYNHDSQTESNGGALGAIVHAYPEALRIPDKENGIFPFMLAATFFVPKDVAKDKQPRDDNYQIIQPCIYSKRVLSSKRPSRWNSQQEDMNILNTIFTLLQMAPDLVIC